MTPSQSSLIQDLMQLLLPVAGAQIVPYATRLAQEFEANGTLISQIEQTLFAVGQMAANNIQGTETRRAQDEHQTPVTYPRFNWTPDTQGSDEERLQHVVNGLLTLGISVNQAPPAPPTPQEVTIDPPHAG